MSLSLPTLSWFLMAGQRPFCRAPWALWAPRPGGAILVQPLLGDLFLHPVSGLVCC